MQYRAGEEHKTHFRCDRFYCADGKWFFTTREHVEMGPFDTHGDAESELIMFIRHTQEGGMYENIHRAAMEGRIGSASAW